MPLIYSQIEKYKICANKIFGRFHGSSKIKVINIKIKYGKYCSYYKILLDKERKLKGNILDAHNTKKWKHHLYSLIKKKKQQIYCREENKLVDILTQYERSFTNKEICDHLKQNIFFKNISYRTIFHKTKILEIYKKILLIRTTINLSCNNRNEQFNLFFSFSGQKCCIKIDSMSINDGMYNVNMFLTKFKKNIVDIKIRYGYENNLMTNLCTIAQFCDVFKNRINFLNQIAKLICHFKNNSLDQISQVIGYEKFNLILNTAALVLCNLKKFICDINLLKCTLKAHDFNYNCLQKLTINCLHDNKELMRLNNDQFPQLTHLKIMSNPKMNFNSYHDILLSFCNFTTITTLTIDAMDSNTGNLEYVQLPINLKILYLKGGIQKGNLKFSSCNTLNTLKFEHGTHIKIIKRFLRNLDIENLIIKIQSTHDFYSPLVGYKNIQKKYSKLKKLQVYKKKSNFFNETFKY